MHILEFRNCSTEWLSCVMEKMVSVQSNVDSTIFKAKFCFIASCTVSEIPILVKCWEVFELFLELLNLLEN